jgi:splicing factor 3B subunit 3
MILEPTSRQFVIIESDHRILPAPESEDMPLDQFGHAKADKATWSSLIRVVNPFTAETTQSILLDNNEAAFSYIFN